VSFSSTCGCRLFRPFSAISIASRRAACYNFADIERKVFRGTSMTCDEFFDALTSSQPLGKEARRHIKQCARCRDLQDTLSPVLGELGSSVGWSERPAESNLISVAATSAQQLTASRPAARRTPAKLDWRFVVAFVGGVAVSLGVTAALKPSPATPQPANSICLWHAHDSIKDPDTQDVVLSCVECHLAMAD